MDQDRFLLADLEADLARIDFEKAALEARMKKLEAEAERVKFAVKYGHEYLKYYDMDNEAFHAMYNKLKIHETTLRKIKGIRIRNENRAAGILCYCTGGTSHADFATTTSFANFA